MEIHRGEEHQHEEPSESFVNYLKRQSDWLEETRGNMMVAATVIASMSFQVMANPPGGVWQSDNCPKNQTGTKEVCTEKAGTSLLAHKKRTAYLAMVISSTISFSASMSIILLAISGLRLRHLTLCGSCGKSAAEKQERCPEPDCGALLTGRVTREWRVVSPSWDEVKNYFPARFQDGLEPDYSTGEKCFLHKDAEHEWTLENESGTSKYKGRLINPETSKSIYYLLMHKNDEELMAVPAGDWYMDAS